jgi:hypothetical protein
MHCLDEEKPRLFLPKPALDRIDKRAANAAAMAVGIDTSQ